MTELNENQGDKAASSEVAEAAESTEASEQASTPEAASESAKTSSEAAAPAATDHEPSSSSSDDESAMADGDEPMITPGMNWFVLRVASNKEDSVRQTLLRKIKIEDLTNLVNRILVPTEKIKTMKSGKQRITERKLYPGYVFVEMKLEDDGRIPQDVFFLIKETTGVGDFIGTAGRPKAMEQYEIEKMIEASKKPDDQPEVKMEFAPGDPVKIKEGPFQNMDAVVDALLPKQVKVRVLVTIFGRSAPVEMEYWLIEKADQ